MRTILQFAFAALFAGGTMMSLAAEERDAGAAAPASDPDGATVAALLTEALAGPDGEYAAHAEYAVILQKFGDVQPYANIIHAEARHIQALQRQFARLALAVPQNPYEGKVDVPATLKEAAQAGVTAEERNVAMYDRLLAQTGNDPMLQRVFSNLQRASREHHLPAFKAAVEGGGQLSGTTVTCRGGGPQRRGGPPWADGQGRGRGWGRCGGCVGGALSTTNAP